MQQSFRALGVSEAVEQALAARGITEPFRIQTLVLPDALEGRDILAKAPTGSGKTLGFGIPLVERTKLDATTPTSLVLVPTRSSRPGRRGDRVVRHGKGVRWASLRRRSRRAGEETERAHRRRNPAVFRISSSADDLARDNVHVLVLDEADRCSTWASSRGRAILRRMPRDPNDALRPRSTARSASLRGIHTDARFGSGT
jgi:hypothetical protein